MEIDARPVGSRSSTAARACSRKGNFCCAGLVNNAAYTAGACPAARGGYRAADQPRRLYRPRCRPRRMNEALDRGNSCRSISKAQPCLCRPHTGAPRLCHWCGGSRDIRHIDRSPAPAGPGPCLLSIGKGKRDEAVKAAVVLRNGAVYLAAIGGAGADGWQRKKLRDHRLAGPWVRGCPPPGSGGYAPSTVLLDAHRQHIYQSGPQAYL